MLISKDENIKTSSVYVASLILKLFYKKKATKLSILRFPKSSEKYEIEHYRQVFFGLAFYIQQGLSISKNPIFI